MKFDAKAALTVYAGALTAVMIGVMVSGAMRQAEPGRFTELEVERINLREPDGTLRLVISNQARFPGIIVKGHDYPHPNRSTAGMLFFNAEGTENGGLIWDGREVDGRVMSGGSLTFDRYHQDQTVQMLGTEEGADRMSGFRVNDQPDGQMDFAAMERVNSMPDGPEKDAAIAAANFGTIPRAFLGRQTSGDSQLVLRDGEGRPRLRLSVGLDGAAKIDFLNETGQVTRTMTPEG